MIKHIVFFKSLESDSDLKQVILDNFASHLKNLESKISQIISLEVGININPKDSAYDISLYSTFANSEDLDIYQKHPEHLKVINEVKKNNLQSVVVDYEIDN